MGHHYMPCAGSQDHHRVEALLPDDAEKAVLETLGQKAPKSVSGARDDPEGALKDLLAALESLGLISDGTTAV